jgi:hypothetical protein
MRAQAVHNWELGFKGSAGRDVKPADSTPACRIGKRNNDVVVDRNRECLSLKDEHEGLHFF